MKTRRGDTMAVLNMDDRSARIEATLFGDAYSEYRELLQKDAILILEGAVNHDDYSGALGMRVNTVRSLEQARQAARAELTIEVTEEQVDEAFADRIRHLLEHASEGQCPVAIAYSQKENRALLRLGERWRVNPTAELIDELQDCCGQGRVSLSYPG
jgi:DNA polymerase-3 subunit alpha